MRLSDIVHDLIEQYDRPGEGIDMHAATEAGVQLVKGDDETLDTLVRDALYKRIKDACTKARRRSENSDQNTAGQPALFDLRARHALDTEGRYVKRTEDLTQFEFRRLIDIRRQQLEADKAYLDELEKAEAALRPIWERHPELTYGQAEQAYIASRTAAE